jgi:hypothetical protein
MALKAKIAGREELMRRLERITPGVTEAAAEAKLEVAKEAANLISAEAPHKTGDYMYAIRGGYQRDNPGIELFGGRQSKDPDAVGVYAPFIWRFLEFGTAPHNVAKGGGTKSGIESARTGRATKLGRKPILHPGSRAFPHVFPVWNGYKKTAKAKISKAINDAVKRSLGK